jgi:hypothetical protein
MHRRFGDDQRRLPYARVVRHHSLERADGRGVGERGAHARGCRALLEEESARRTLKACCGRLLARWPPSPCTALSTLRCRSRIVALSTYLLCENGSSGLLQGSTPPLPAGLHGARHLPTRQCRPNWRMERGRDALRAAGISLEWRTYPMGHSLCPRGSAGPRTWLAGRLK